MTQSNQNTALIRKPKKPASKNNVKNILSEMARCIDDEKIREIKIYDKLVPDFIDICNVLATETGVFLTDSAKTLEKCLENARTENFAKLSAGFLMAVYTGIRIHSTPKLMFEKWIYLKEVIPRLFWDENNETVTIAVLEQMMEVHNRYVSRLKWYHKDLKVIRDDQGYINIEKKYAKFWTLDEVQTKKRYSGGMYKLPLYLAAHYAMLIPRQDLDEGQRIYLEKNMTLFNRFRSTDPYLEDARDKLCEIWTECCNHVSFKYEIASEYRGKTYPQLSYIITYMIQSESCMAIAKHYIDHTEMSKEERLYYGMDNKTLFKDFFSMILKDILLPLPIFILRKFYPIIAVLLILKFMFHLNILSIPTSLFSLITGVFTGICEIIGFVIHNPLLALFMVIFIAIAPRDLPATWTLKKKDISSPYGDGIYHDVYYETKMPKSTAGNFDVNSYAQWVRHGGEKMPGDMS